MPVSKKKRKNGKVKKSGPSYHLRVEPDLIEVFRSIYRDAQLAVELKLPMGNIEQWDMKILSDMFNVGTVGFINRTWLDQAELDDFEPEFKAAKEALHTVYMRGKEAKRWVCTGDELNLIRDAIMTLGGFIEDSLSASPLLFIKEFIVMDLLTEKVGNGGEITKEDIDWAMKQIENGNGLRSRIKQLKNRERKNDNCTIA